MQHRYTDLHERTSMHHAPLVRFNVQCATSTYFCVVHGVDASWNASGSNHYRYIQEMEIFIGLAVAYNIHECEHTNNHKP